MIVLREAVKTDLTAFFELDQACFGRGIAYSLREFRSLLTSPLTIGLVAAENGLLAGFVIAQDVRSGHSPGGHIVTIDVAAAFRRRGVGSLLMAGIEMRLSQAGAEWLRLEVAVENSAAREFYFGLGFETTGRVANYYGKNLDGLIMQKPLGASSTFVG
jgi:ribosomal protein S18 acetylase RimI-like enzyme